ncbi:pyridoxine/pyridoxamine 5'-phosphate oxidase [Streptomyces lichenis]|uniref:Pyridoxal 5'-phosphate synthase n=1 Tax=Streptomyces lichenis TaxID=2306967 RepID=A0ABT0ICV3_9ACTN|nr:pyridoxal 5'-phosphate synthase [Streptomyces lichenis]MCK8679153.1 pyridoxal 5'-phosphate synthase [Streptomyces lichenis]
MDQARFDEILRAQPVWDTELPSFDPDRVPSAPLPLFHDWFAAAAEAGQAEPHTMTLATVDAEGRPDARVVILHGADEHGWHFATHATSAKGRQLAAAPDAALCFYWPAQGRQIRVRGTVVSGTPEEAYEDLHVRSTGALAAALVGRQSEVLDSLPALTRASEAAWERAQEEPETSAETWTVYALTATEAEFFQGDARRRHVRLRYRRAADGDGVGWVRELLWP